MECVMWNTLAVTLPKYFRAAQNYGLFTGCQQFRRWYQRGPQVVISDFVGLSDKMFLPT